MSAADETHEDALLEVIRSAAPTVPAGLSERVLQGLREAAAAQARFREELERSARGVLLAAAACLTVCGALFLGQGEASAPTTADGRPSRVVASRSPRQIQTPSGTDQASSRREPASSSQASIDDGEALSLTSTQGVLEGELTQGLWLFASTESE